MTMQAMPCDIVLGIIHHARWENNSRVKFKQQLILLAVSQRLRAIALPIIYKHVYITSSKHKSRKSQKYVNKYSKVFANYFDTNADIIALANCTHVVKSAIIYVDGINTPYIEFHNSIKTLQSCANLWPKVNKLTIYLEYNNSSGNPSETHLLQLNCMGKGYSLELVNIMPNVTKLSLSIRVSICDTSELYNQVTGAYANQLVKLTNRNNFDYKDTYKLQVIQYLNMRLGYRITRLPQVNSHTLVDLYIGNILFNLSWAPFLDSKNDTVIEFSCLRKLGLEFGFHEATEDTNVDMPELLLNFPELRSLKIISQNSTCPFFKMAIFPQEMDVVNIRAPPVLLAQIKDVGTPTAKKMRLTS